jgi:hypothetical protein
MRTISALYNHDNGAGIMSDHELAPLCIEKFRQLDEHVKDSPGVRDAVTRHNNQIVTLEKAHEATMADIREIKKDIGTINEGIKDLNSSVKIWVLSGIVGTVMAFAIPTMMLFYNAGQMNRQIDINTERWNNVISGAPIK